MLVLIPGLTGSDVRCRKHIGSLGEFKVEVRGGAIVYVCSSFVPGRERS